MPTPKEEMETLFKEEYQTISESRKLLDQQSLISNTSEDVEVHKDFIVEASVHAPPKSYEELEQPEGQKISENEIDKPTPEQVEESDKPVADENQEIDKCGKEKDLETGKNIVEQFEVKNMTTPKESDSITETENIEETKTTPVLKDNDVEVTEEEIKINDTPTDKSKKQIVDVTEEGVEKFTTSENQIASKITDPNELRPESEDIDLKITETTDDQKVDTKPVDDNGLEDSQKSGETSDKSKNEGENDDELLMGKDSEETIEVDTNKKRTRR
ncbi:hypothetical protein NQ314_009951 [Rhamnusium bicolor]|uniref:Uncharacterized protein n=1 Tax=Rhamnusium bicolor TaxID=1586634 RepID=A0AAV8XYC6_9CUCU|nr:hypothetical protein NQ314_009951 [Rhamnusium bicolor]